MSAWTTRSGWQRAAATAATLLAVGVLAACGSDDEKASADGGSSASAEVSSGASSDDTAAEAGSFDLPDGWDLDSLPVPPGAEAEDTTTSDDNPSFALFDTDADAVMAFYRQALPDAGLQVTSDGPAGSRQAIQATGPGMRVLVLGDDVMVSVSVSRASS
jgi:hypothetical protein